MKRILFFATFSSVLTFFSCSSDESTIRGQVVYEGLLGIESEAAGADVYLYENSALGAPATSSEMRATADNDGNFVFDNVPDGNYQLYGRISENGTEYEGTSATVQVEDDDDKTVNLLLED